MQIIYVCLPLCMHVIYDLLICIVTQTAGFTCMCVCACVYVSGNPYLYLCIYIYIYIYTSVYGPCAILSLPARHPHQVQHRNAQATSERLHRNKKKTCELSRALSNSTSQGRSHWGTSSTNADRSRPRAHKFVIGVGHEFPKYGRHTPLENPDPSWSLLLCVFERLCPTVGQQMCHRPGHHTVTWRCRLNANRWCRDATRSTHPKPKQLLWSRQGTRI